MFAAFGAMLALRARDLTGAGQDVDMALYEAVWRMSGTHIANFGLQGKDRERSGNYFPGVVPAEQFETADGHFLVINATTQRAFVKLCEAIGQPELVADPRFTPRAHLLQNHALIHGILGTWVGARSLSECQATLDRHGVPATKVYLMEDIAGDPHYADRHQVVSVETPDHGHLLQPGVVPILTGTPGRIPGRAPMLGEHNDEVFRGLLAMSEPDLEELRSKGLV